MSISAKYIVVEKFEEEKKDGYQTVDVQDSFTYKGKVIELPEVPVYVSNHQVMIGDVVMFAKYSPSTHEIEENGKLVKFITLEDILKVWPQEK